MVQFSEITNAKIEEFLNGHGIEIDLIFQIPNSSSLKSGLPN